MILDEGMSRICTDCREDWEGPVCECGCNEYDDITTKDLEGERTGGLDWDA